MIKIFLLFLLFTITIRAQNVIYFDNNWNETTKENHAFYRPMPLKKVGELLLLVDHYKNGKMQFQGYIKPENEEVYIGDVYWYDENGFDKSMTQNINETSQKELTYYNQDGSIWQKIIYNENGKKSKITTYLNGKELFSGSILEQDKYKGTFSPKIPDYYYRRFQEENETVYVEIAPIPGIETQGNSNQSKPKEFYFEVIYWENGQKAKESKFVFSEYGYKELMDEKYWDETGKLISEINFENFSKEKKYLKVNYLTRNNFAVKTEYILEMKNKSREGKSSFYDLNGKLIREEIYAQGLLKEEIIHSDINKKSTRLYKKDEPFEGDFTQKVGPFEFSYKMENGKKVDQETVKNLDSQEIVAQGLYKDNLPFDGKFISTERYIVSNYKKGILDGLQVIYENFYDDVPAEEYEIKNGKREGFRRIYKIGELKYESLYKNDSIFSGKILEGDEELTYVNGMLTQKIVLSNGYDKGFELIEKYENNKISSVEYFNFTIAENPKESYLGTYKNGFPYEGYFANNVIIDDIHLIDYFENGKIKYQYSFDILEQMESYHHYYYNQKAEFENGKVLNGAEFFPNANGYLKINYKDEIVNGLEVNLFAMHYFNRINFIREQNEIIVSEFQSPYKVKIFTKDNFLTASLYENDKLIKTQELIDEIKEGNPNSATFYYLKENEILTFSMQRDIFDEYERVDREQFTVKILSIFPMSGRNLDDVMSHFSKAFQSSDYDHLFDVADSSFFPFSEKEFLTSLEYDKNGKPEFGIRIIKENNGEILLESIDNNKVKKSVKVKSISELIANNNQILKDLMYKLLND